LGPLRHPAKGHLYTTATKDPTQQLSLLFPASTANWPFASAVVRELSGGNKGADSGSPDGSARQDFTTQSAVEAESGPEDEEVQNFRVLQLLSAAEQRLQGSAIGPRVAPILQHLIPELRSLRPIELAALCKALSDIGWQDSLVDLVLGVVSMSSLCPMPLQSPSWLTRIAHCCCGVTVINAYSTLLAGFNGASYATLQRMCH